MCARKATVFILVGMVFIQGCVTTRIKKPIGISEIERRIPIGVSDKNLPEFGVAKFKSSVVGSVVGGHYDGIARIKWQTYYGIKLDATTQERFGGLIRDELEKAGYKVCGG